ncbi:MAG: type II secretion system protein [Planctomycetota bacterium]
MRNDCGLRIADCGLAAREAHLFGKRARVHLRRSAFRLPPSAFATRSGFTLVELLVSISIVAILAALVLGVAGVAAETGREAKTKQMITRLHTLVMEHYDTFRDKRVSLRITDINNNGREDYADALADNGVNLASRGEGETRAIGLLAGAREQMKMEMPDRWSDFLMVSLGADDTNAGDPLPPLNTAQTPVYLRSIPPLAQVYRTRYAQIQARGGVTAGQLVSNQGAECLYMIIVYATGDGESRGLFKETDIGDTDGDGAPEILDGWGNPIQFLRWAPGYSSELQLSIDRLQQRLRDVDPPVAAFDPDNLSSLNNDQRAAIARFINADRDPLDLFRVDNPVATSSVFEQNGVRGFRLVPLVYSAGRDESLGIRADSWFDNPSSDPYFHDTDTGTESPGEDFLGDPLSDEQTDNITNHLITSQ